jgi:hypothetical protein
MMEQKGEMFTSLQNIIVKRSISMPRTTKRVEQEFELAEIAISNTLADRELYAVLAACGYDTARLREGSQLCEKARASHQRQKGEYGELHAANKALDAARQQVRASYIRHVEMARVAFKDDLAVRDKLGLAAKRKVAHAGWLEQARQFYSYALSDPAILGPLSRFGITQDVLKESQRQLASVLEHNAARWRRKGAARDATIARDQARAELSAWLRDFMKVARIVCKGQPQLLDKLGIPPRAQDRAARVPNTPSSAAPAPSRPETLSVAEEPPPTTGRRNGQAATADREA